MKKLVVMFAAMMLMVSLLAFAQAPADTQGAQGEHHGRGQGRGMGMSPDQQLEHMSQTLNLTEDQKTKIKPILEEQSNKMHQLMQDTSTAPQDKRAKFQEIHENTMSQIKPILTPDQVKKLESMREGGGQGRGAHSHPDQTSPQ